MAGRAVVKEVSDLVVDGSEATISTVTSINVLDRNLSAKWKIISCNWVIVNCKNQRWIH